MHTLEVMRLNGVLLCAARGYSRQLIAADSFRQCAACSRWRTSTAGCRTLFFLPVCDADVCCIVADLRQLVSLQDQLAKAQTPSGAPAQQAQIADAPAALPHRRCVPRYHARRAHGAHSAEKQVPLDQLPNRQQASQVAANDDDCQEKGSQHDGKGAACPHRLEAADAAKQGQSAVEASIAAIRAWSGLDRASSHQPLHARAAMHAGRQR